jgi:hypothetical protein
VTLEHERGDDESSISGVYIALRYCGVHTAIIYGDDHDRASGDTDPGQLCGRVGCEYNYCL